jgi:hypothetical protein
MGLQARSRGGSAPGKDEIVFVQSRSDCGTDTPARSCSTQRGEFLIRCG